MSIWYDVHVDATAKNAQAVAKFFNIDIKDVHTSHFEFSFGEKNAPGLNLNKIIENNPDIIFLIRISCEHYAPNFYLSKFDTEYNTIRAISVQNHGEINLKLLDLYEQSFPGLANKHYLKEDVFKEFRWSLLFSDYSKAEEILNNYTKYSQMINLTTVSNDDVEFDNVPLDNE